MGRFLAEDREYRQGNRYLQEVLFTWSIRILWQNHGLKKSRSFSSWLSISFWREVNGQLLFLLLIHDLQLSNGISDVNNRNILEVCFMRHMPYTNNYILARALKFLLSIWVTKAKHLFQGMEFWVFLKRNTFYN